MKKLRFQNPDQELKVKIQKLGARFYRRSASWLLPDTPQHRQLLSGGKHDISVTPLPCLRDHQVKAIKN